MAESLLQEIPSQSPQPAALRPKGEAQPLQVALLTGGIDKTYVLGLASTLASQNVFVDVIGSDEIDSPQLHQDTHLKFLNLRGDQRKDAALLEKMRRIT